jgi:hypothetical protein
LVQSSSLLENRALITGGSGFLGSHLCDRLLDRVSSECMEDKSKLWAIWKEMFAFPQEPPKKVKVESKPAPKELVEAAKEEKPKAAEKPKVVVEDESSPTHKAEESPSTNQSDVAEEMPKAAENPKVVVEESPSVNQSVSEDEPSPKKEEKAKRIPPPM